MCALALPFLNILYLDRMISFSLGIVVLMAKGMSNMHKDYSPLLGIGIISPAHISLAKTSLLHLTLVV